VNGLSFWRVTARRSIGLSITYLVMAVVLAVMGMILSNIGSIIPPDLVSGQVDPNAIFPYISVAILSLTALIIATPVVILFVYDRNNGVFEYLLSTGSDQLDIYKAYLKAALFLAAGMLAITAILNAAIGAYLGVDPVTVATIAALTFVIGLSSVSLMTVAMMAFSSLQKSQVGANQPLGIAVGILPVIPALVLPLLNPSLATILDGAVAASIGLISLALLLSAGKLISREKMLP
jgi:hypothetical protein